MGLFKLDIKLILLIALNTVHSSYGFVSCDERNPLQCVKDIQGRPCITGEMSFKRDCIECVCGHYGYYSCKNLCTKTLPDAFLADDSCAPGSEFAREFCTICLCDMTGKKSLSNNCAKKLFCD